MDQQVYNDKIDYLRCINCL